MIDLEPPGGAAPRPKRVVLESERDVVVAVDAGHGGEDPGAIGVGRIYEKRVVLEIAKAVKRNLDAMPGLSATLVRRGDYYIPLRRRAEIARGEDVRADVFVSIHADAFRLPSVRGSSVYALSERGASSETARWLAEGANQSDLIGGVSGSWVSLNEVEDPQVRPSAGGFLHGQSARRQHRLGRSRARRPCRGVEAAQEARRIGWLRGAQVADVPSVLIETGFLSNPDEARLLATAAHQRRVAGAIAEGIQAYALRNPPQGTLLASAAAGGVLRYVIKRGDTLSEIAERTA